MHNRHSFDLQLLTVLQAIAQTGSVSGAGRHLNMSQPAVSRSLARLRMMFEDPLFVRRGNAMEPTPRGVGVCAQAGEVLAAVDGMLQPARFEPCLSTKDVTLCLGEFGETVVLPQLLDAFARIAPNVLLRTVMMQGEALEDALAEGTIDLIVGDYPEIGGASLYQQLLFTHPFACLVRDNHPIAGNELSREEFQDLDHVTVREDDWCQRFLARRLIADGIRYQVNLQTQHFISLPAILKRSDLCATVPLALGMEFSLMTGLRVLRPIGIPDLQVRQYWHRRFHFDERSRWLRSMIVNSLGRKSA